MESGGKNAKTYQLQKGNSSPFVEYGDNYIRKSTALYLIQENDPLSNDRLLRVRATQPSHLYSATNVEMNARHRVRAGELCVFSRVDSEERLLLGRVIQFSYMYGNKRERQYTSNYVDLSKDSKTNIGVLCNLYQCVSFNDEEVFFRSLNTYTAGYLTLDSSLLSEEDFSFAILISNISKVISNWKADLVVDAD